MLMFLVRILFYVLLWRLLMGVLRGLGVLGSAPQPPRPRRPARPPHSPASTEQRLGGDIVDAEFEDLPLESRR